jgi:hypothetical protein
MTDARPFEAWLELKRVDDPARVEDIVVFIGVGRDHDTLRPTVDISTGEGVVLADGPAITVTVDADGAWRSDILAYIAETETFLEDSFGILREALC